VHPAIRRSATLLVFVAPLALSGATSVSARMEPLPPRPARTLVIDPPPAQPTDVVVADRDESAVVLVVLDGVRWQEVFRGVDPVLARRHGIAATEAEPMPNLHRMIDGEGMAIGAPGRGAEISASGPQFISLPGYIEIFSGKPDVHCRRNDCDPVPSRTIADEIAESNGPGDVAMISSWPNIARAASAAPSFVVSAGRKILEREDTLRADPGASHLLDVGSRAKAWPGEGDYRPDAFTAQLALRHLAAARPRFLFVGLGDADECAHRNDYRGYLDAIRAADQFLGDLEALLATPAIMGARGRHTTVLVTADHGRAYDFTDHGPRFPESGRVWLVAGGADVAGRGLVASPQRRTLSEVAPTVRALLGMAETEGSLPAIPEIVGSR
jgi:hypothetical protein